MSKKNRQSISAGDGSFNIQSVGDTIIHIHNSDYPTNIIDDKINEEVTFIRKARFFVEFDKVKAVLTLGRKLIEGDFSRGTAATKSQALAWCARLLAYSPEEKKAEEFLNIAKSLGTCSEVDIAEAFLFSQKEDMSTALRALARIDSPASHTASFMIVYHHNGAEEAIDWLRKTGIETIDIDAEGKYSFLTRQIELGLWKQAKESLPSLEDQDFKSVPSLHYMTAIIELASTVPIELRSLLLKQLPFEAATFPLASDITSLEARKNARNHFINASIAVQQLNCTQAAKAFEDYALWLDLRDPMNSENGRQQLEMKLSDTKTALRLVPLGLQFGVNLDIDAIQQEIERQIALNGRITQDAAIARFALVFKQKTPGSAGNYIAQHYNELSKYLDKKSLRFLQIKLFSEAGLLGKANECLSQLLSEGISKEEEERLHGIISEIEGANPIEIRMNQFKQSDSLSDLVSLIDELELRENWDELCNYSEVLFEATHSVRDAERIVKAMSHTHQYGKLVEFLQANLYLLSQSKVLQMLYAWGLYYEGAFLEARTELAKLGDNREDPNYRALEINLSIAMGDWNSLTAIVAKEYNERKKRSSQELIKIAQLAFHIASPYAKDLLFDAVKKSDNSAAILASAYFLASSAGWERDSEVVQWLQKAADLSGDEGPIKKMTLKDILDLKPHWDRRESETLRLLSRGEIPISLAAESLNKSLVDLTLFPAFANKKEADPRRRSIIPIYSGKRLPVIDITNKTVGFDAHSLLTLSYLGLLEKTLDFFNEIYIPHSTLLWLFEEKQKAIFHQPSKIKDAHKVRDLLARDILKKLIPSTILSSELAEQVGDELALLISEAEKVRDNDSIQRIVIRSSPVHRPSSLMEEEADLSGHTNVISSCLAVVEFLRKRGQITTEEEKRARAYLQLHEKAWPNQPEITNGAVLYLDSLAMSYFLHIGILEKIHDAGFRIITTTKYFLEVDALINYESISEQEDKVIEHIRSAINSRIESGKIKAGNMFNITELESVTESENPTIGVINLVSKCEAIISDDRFINQHEYISDNKVRTPLLTTLDLLNAFVSKGIISSEDLLEKKALLRRSGFSFILLDDKELEQHLKASTVENEIISETAELKAIRENILQARMRDWLQIPKEAPWLDNITNSFIRALKKLWTEDTDINEVKVRSNWLLDQLDIRGWVHLYEIDKRDGIIRIGHGVLILAILTPPVSASTEIREAYLCWAEESILSPIKEKFPELYEWIVEQQKRYISGVAEREVIKGEQNE